MACECNGNDTCSCTVVGGLNVTVTGFGTSREPLRLDVEPAYLEATSTATVDAMLTGAGDTDYPYFLTMTIAADVLGGLARRWFGTEADFADITTMIPGTLYVVTADA